MTDTLVFDFVEQTVGLVDATTGEEKPMPDGVELVGTASPPPRGASDTD